jgi:hypothetical protein
MNKNGILWANGTTYEAQNGGTDSDHSVCSFIIMEDKPPYRKNEIVNLPLYCFDAFLSEENHCNRFLRMPVECTLGQRKGDPSTATNRSLLDLDINRQGEVFSGHLTVNDKEGRSFAVNLPPVFYKAFLLISERIVEISKRLEEEKNQPVKKPKKNNTPNKDCLTPAQRLVLGQMELGKEYSAYDLQASLATLAALEKKGYLTSKQGAGSFSMPRVGIEYKKIKEPTGE